MRGLKTDTKTINGLGWRRHIQYIHMERTQRGHDLMISVIFRDWSKPFLNITEGLWNAIWYFFPNPLHALKKLGNALNKVRGLLQRYC